MLTPGNQVNSALISNNARSISHFSFFMRASRLPCGNTLITDGRRIPSRTAEAGKAAPKKCLNECIFRIQAGAEGIMNQS